VYVGLRLLLPSEARSVPVARKVLGNALTSMGVTRGCVDDIEVAISEACTNVLDHAGDHEYALHAGIDGGYCVVEVTDEGRGFPDPPVVAAEGVLINPEAERGRGIQLMRALVDDLDFAACEGGGTMVRLRKMLAYDP
jgi:serine/threonine-protein kinase RsbW